MSIKNALSVLIIMGVPTIKTFTPNSSLPLCNGGMEACGVCPSCSQYCDVCGEWYPLDDTCKFH